MDGPAPLRPLTISEPKNVMFLPEVFADPPREPEVLIKGLIRKGELVVVGAPRGAFKSWMAMDLALRLGSGTGALFDEFPIVTSSRVLMLHGELDPWAAYQRWGLLCDEVEPPATVAQTFEPWRLRVVKTTVVETYKDEVGTHRESVQRLVGRIDQPLREVIEEHTCDVLIIDPFRAFFVGEESSNDEIEAGLSALTEFARKRDLTVVLLHHFSMSGRGRDPEDSWRGASRLPDWASLRITLDPRYTPAEAKKQGMSRSQARQYAVAKFLARRDETPSDFPIKFNMGSGRWIRWHDGSGATGSRDDDLSPSLLADACQKAGGEWSSTRRAADDLDVSQATAKKALDAAVRAGKLVEFEGPRNARGYRLPTSWDPVGGSS